ncbi:hypothetical protein MN608_10925 [Microdochium nivale]|nr:hypothetical protein MN608_10925 [Microdochium nivale]
MRMKNHVGLVSLRHIHLAPSPHLQITRAPSVLNHKPEAYSIFDNMIFTQTILLALVAAATAIDIRFYSSGNCGGSYTTCPSATASRCCRAPAQRFSVEFVGIPKAMRMRGTSFVGNNCQHAYQGADSAGRTSICLVGGSPHSGASYKLLSKKRGTNAVVSEEGVADDQGDEECARPDSLVLEDGTTFDLAELSETAYETMYVEPPRTSRRPVLHLANPWKHSHPLEIQSIN